MINVVTLQALVGSILLRPPLVIYRYYCPNHYVVFVFDSAVLRQVIHE
jgi:hypothetical protein